MGSFIELNDTLQITTEQGFPADFLDFKNHQKNPVTIADVEGKTYKFHDKPRARIYQSDPVRVYYIHNIKGKWLFWGRILIQSQTIEKKCEPDGSWKEKWVTSGSYQIMDIYDPQYQEQFTRREAPSDRNYFTT